MSPVSRQVFDAGGVFTLVPVTEEHTEEDEDVAEDGDPAEVKPTGWMAVVSAEDGINVEDPQQ